MPRQMFACQTWASLYLLPPSACFTLLPRNGSSAAALCLVPGAPAFAAEKRREEPNWVLGIVQRIVDAVYQRLWQDLAIYTIQRLYDVVHRHVLNGEHGVVEHMPGILSGDLAANAHGRPFIQRPARICRAISRRWP